MFGDQAKMIDFYRPIKKCLDGIFAPKCTREFKPYPFGVLALLDAVIVYFSLSKILCKTQSKYGNISRRKNGGFFGPIPLEKWFNKYNPLDIIAFYLRYYKSNRVSEGIMEVIDCFDGDNKKIMAVILAAWTAKIPISERMNNFLYTTANMMSEYPYCRWYICTTGLERK